MVLLRIAYLFRANSDCKGPFEGITSCKTLDSQIIRNILFKLCNDAVGTNGFTCLLKHGRARDNYILVTHPMTSLSSSYFTFIIEACQLKIMAAIPPSAFTAGRIRETQRNKDMKIAKKMPKANEFTKFFDTKFAELSPLKYNSKLMNSIWGLYNRYSPHNVKKVNEAFVLNGDLQQSAVNSPNKAEPVITLPPTSFENVWAAIASQSH